MMCTLVNLNTLSTRFIMVYDSMCMCIRVTRLKTHSARSYCVLAYPL